MTDDRLLEGDGRLGADAGGGPPGTQSRRTSAVTPEPSTAEINLALSAGYGALRTGAFSTHHSLEELYAYVVAQLPEISLEPTGWSPARTTRSYILSSNAEEDLRAIWAFVAKHEGEDKARAAVGDVVTEIGWLALMPSAGRKMPDLDGAPHCHQVRWALYYGPIPDDRGIEVVRILDDQPYFKGARVASPSEVD